MVLQVARDAAGGSEEAKRFTLQPTTMPADAGAPPKRLSSERVRDAVYRAFIIPPSK